MDEIKQLNGKVARQGMNYPPKSRRKIVTNGKVSKEIGKAVNE